MTKGRLWVVVALCALMLISSLQLAGNASACGGGDGDDGRQIDIFIDQSGYKHKVWREEVNGTYQVFYANNIGHKHHGVGHDGIQITHSQADVMYPQVSIDPINNLSYVLWLIDHAGADEFWYAGTVDFSNWSNGWYGGNATLPHGNPDLDMSASNYELHVTWKHHGAMTIKPDLDGDFIPDSNDSAPLKYDSGMGNYFIADAVSVDATIGISIAIDYEGNSTVSPAIEQVEPLTPIAGSIAPYINATLSTDTNFTSLIRYKYNRSSLPPYVNESYLRIYLYDESWQLIGDMSGRKGGVDVEKGYVWALTDHLCTITIADASATDLNGNGIPDIWDLSTGNVPERLTIFSGDSLYPKTYISPTNVLNLAWLDTRDGGYSIYYKKSDDFGKTWTTDTSIASSNLEISALDFAGDGDHLALIWVQTVKMVNPVRYERMVYLEHSTDGGNTWEEIWLRDLGVNPSVAVQGNDIYTVYERISATGGDIPHVYLLGLRFAYNQDGTMFQTTIIYTESGDQHLVPKIATCGANLYVVWAGYFTSSPNELYYMESSDMGQTWSSYTPITEYNGENDPGAISFKAKSDKLYLLWSDKRDGQYEIYYKEKTTSTWSADFRLTTSVIDSKYPNLALDSSNARHIVWQEEASGIPETYYMKLLGTLTSSEDVAIGEIPIVGTIQGTYQDTLISDDSYETFTETIANTIYANAYSESTIIGSKSGDYTKTFSSNNDYEILATVKIIGTTVELKHQWSFTVNTGVSRTIYIEGHRPTATNPQFQFSYSINGDAFIPFYTPPPSSADSIYSYNLPSDTDGTIVIQIENMDKSIGGAYSIDWIEIQTAQICDELEHKWVMSISSASQYIFKVETHLDSDANGDQYSFSYSTDDTTYINMFTVTDTIDTLYSFILPNQLPSTIYVRFVDTVRNPSTPEPGKLYLDRLYILAETQAINIVIPPTLISDDDGISSAYPSIALDSYDNYYIYWNDLKDGNWELDFNTDLIASASSIDPIVSAIRGLPDDAFSTESSATPESLINTAELFRNTLTSKLETLTYIMAANDYVAAYGRIQTDILPNIDSMIVNQTAKGGLDNSINSVGDIIESLTGLQPPGVPWNLYVVPAAELGALTITWNAPTSGGSPTGYWLYRSTNNYTIEWWRYWKANPPNPPNPSIIYNITPNLALGDIDRGLTDITTYYYGVVAFNGVGESDFDISPDNYEKMCIPPYVTSTSPANNAQGISRAAPVYVYITFSEPMQTGTVSLTICPSVPYTPSWSSDKLTLTITITSNLAYSQWYSVKILGTAAALSNDPSTTLDDTLDSNGNGMGQGPPTDDYILNFQTQQSPYPMVGSYSPYGNQVDYMTIQPIIVAFTKPMYHGTGNANAANVFNIAPSTSGSFSWSADYKTLTFTPSTMFIEGTYYTFSIAGTAQTTDNPPYTLDGNGNGILDPPDNFIGAFRTKLKPVDLQVTTSSTTFYLSWTWTSQSSHTASSYPYNIYISDTSVGPYSLISTTTANSYTVSTAGMPPYKSYYFKIQAYNDVNCWSYSEAISAENRNLNYYLEVGSAGDQDPNILIGYQHLGLTLYPAAASDGWSNPIDSTTSLTYRIPSTTNEGPPYGQKFLLNIPFDSPDLHVDFLITMHYKASGSFVLQQCTGWNPGTGELTWEDIGMISGHIGWENVNLVTDHAVHPYYDHQAAWADINVLFRFKDPSCVYLDWIKFEPVIYNVDIGQNDNNIVMHSPGVSLYPAEWNTGLETDGSRHGQAQCNFYINVPDLSLPFYIRINYKTEATGASGLIRQYNGGSYHIIGSIIRDTLWHTDIFEANPAWYSDYDPDPTHPFYNVLFEFSVSLYVKSISISPDSDLDGFSDYEEVINGADRLDDMNPGPIVRYKTSFMTRDYWCWGNAAQYVAYNQDGAVIRRGSTFDVMVAEGATLTIPQTYTPAPTATYVSSGRYSISIPANCAIGKYQMTATKGGRSVSSLLYVVFELPTVGGELAQSDIDWYTYDESQDRDERSFIIPSSGYLVAWGLKQYTKEVFEIAIELTSGTTTRDAAANNLCGFANLFLIGDWDKHDGTVTNPLINQGYNFMDDVLRGYSSNSVEIYHGQCCDFASLNAALGRSIGIPTREITARNYNLPPSYTPNECDIEWDYHAWIEIWDGTAWWVYDPTDFNDGEGKYFTDAMTMSSDEFNALSPEDKVQYHLYLQGTGSGFMHMSRHEYYNADDNINPTFNAAHPDTIWRVGIDYLDDIEMTAQYVG